MVDCKRVITRGYSYLCTLAKRILIDTKEANRFRKAKQAIKYLVTRQKNNINAFNENYFDLKNKHMLYIRLDYWTKNTVGGSISHTVNVIKEFCQLGVKVTAILPREYEELTVYDVEQVVLPSPKYACFRTILCANPDCSDALKKILAAKQIDFIYERCIPGMYAGAEAASQWSIPYIVEYNGSEKIMHTSYAKNKNLYQTEFDTVEKIMEESGC